MHSADDKTRGAPGAPLPFEKYLDGLVKLGGVLSAVLILAILVLTIASVVCRYIIGSALLGSDEATGFLIVAAIMFGAAEALRSGDHIGIDVVIDMVSARIRFWLGILSHVAVLVFSGVMLASAWRAITFSLRFEAYSTGALELPLWIPQSTMLIGATLLGLVALTKLLVAVLRKTQA
ncbi:MAG: TRAP transporter small permease [Ferrovibrio sp.]